MSLIAVALCCGQARSQTATDYYYDVLGRLIGAEDGTGKAVGYTYDLAGNRTSLSNLVSTEEIRPIGFTNYPTGSSGATGGLTTPNGMRDGVFTQVPSIYTSKLAANAWVTADFGSVQHLDHVDLAPAQYSTFTQANVNGALLQWSIDGATWSAPVTVTGAIMNAYVSIQVGGANARYVRLTQPSSTVPLVLGDFRFYSSAITGNQNPVAASFTVAVAPAVTTNIDLTAHMSDPDGNAVRAISVGAANNGVSQFVDGHTVSYRPNAGTSSDSFTYNITDDRTGSASGLITINVAQAPQVGPVSTPVPNAAVDYQINPSFIGGGAATSVTALPPTRGGHVRLSADNLHFLYSPLASFSGQESFDYYATNAGGSGNTATVTLNVAAAPLQKPVLAPSTMNLPFGNASYVVPINLVSGGAPTSTTIEPPLNGGSSIGQLFFDGSGTLYYHVNSNVWGADWFYYSGTNAAGKSNVVRVDVNVAPPGAPTVSDVYAPAFPFDANVEHPITLAINGYSDSVTVESQPSYPRSQAVGFSPQGMSWHQDGGFWGDDSFTYSVSNGPGGKSNIATIHIHVNTPPAPTVSNGSLTVAYNTPGSVTLGVAGVYNLPLSVPASSQKGGTVAVSGTTATYTPAQNFSGDDSFTFTANGPGGPSAPGTISVHVSNATLSASIDSSSYSRNWTASGWNGLPTYVHVSPSGGSGTIHYRWVAIADDQTITLNGQGTANATWSRTYDGTIGTYSATWQCIVTDDGGHSVTVGPVNVSFTQNDVG